LDEIKLIVFDLEGTLIKHTTRQAKLVENAITKNGIDVKINIEENYFLRSKPEYHDAKNFVKKILELNKFIVDENKLNKIVETYKELRENPEYLFDLQQVFKGTYELLKLLKEKNVKCALITNANSVQNNYLLDRFNLLDFFEVILDKSSGLPDKPATDRLDFVLKKLNISPRATLVVDDSVAGLVMGKKIGAKTCGVLTGNSTKAELDEFSPDCICDSVADLILVFK
jgi:beta-phosphoglucomutase